MPKAVLLFLYLLPSVFSFECNRLSGNAYAECLIVDSLPLEEKDSWYSAILHPESWQPMHDLIYSYNVAIPVKERPVEASVVSGKYVKNAWVKLLAVMPSVYDNKLLVPSQITVRSAYGYQKELPSAIIFGDCNTFYRLLNEKASLDVFVNNIKQASGEIVSVRIDRDSLLESRLSVFYDLEIQYYINRRYCSRYRNGRCMSYSYRCSYSYSEFIKEQINVKDNITVYLDNSVPIVILQPLNKYLGSTTAKISSTSNFDLTFLYSSLSDYHTTYDVIFYLKPYDFAQIRTQSFNHTSINNLFYSNNTISVKDSNSCQITVWNHFYKTSKQCDLSQAKELSFVPLTKSSFSMVLPLFLFFIVSSFILFRRN